MVVAFTGHRPEKLPWGNHGDDPACAALQILLERKIAEQIGSGAELFLCGMARGCDFYFAEAVLRQKVLHPQIRLEAVLPCADQADRWDAADRERYREILGRCDRVTLLQQAYSDGCMLRRNRAMVDRCDVLMSVWDGSPGGTASAVRYARSLGKRILPLWL